MEVIDLEVKEIVYSVFSRGLRQAIPHGVMLNVEVSQRFIEDLILLEAKAQLLGEKLPEHIVHETKQVSYPNSTWQYFKNTHKDSWWLKKLVQKWPVQEKTVDVSLIASWEQMAVYPWQTLINETSRTGQAVRIVQEPRIIRSSNE